MITRMSSAFEGIKYRQQEQIYLASNEQWVLNQHLIVAAAKISSQCVWMIFYSSGIHNCSAGESIVSDLKEVEMSHQLTNSLSVAQLQPVNPSASLGGAARCRQSEGDLTLIFCPRCQVPSGCFQSRVWKSLPFFFVLVKPSWAAFSGPSWHQWALTAVTIKWKQIRGRSHGLWNSTALCSQISCPLHLSIQDHWLCRQFNLLSGLWLVMIYWVPFVLQLKPA